METKGPFKPVDEDKMNKKMKSDLDDFVDIIDCALDDVKENKKGTSSASNRIVESLDKILNTMKAISINESDNLDNTLVAEDSVNDDKDLLERLNKLYTPTLISQKFENDIADNANNEIQNSGNLSKRTLINFDKKTRVAQLISACAMLIAEKKNSPKWQALLKADAIKNQTKLDIQREEYNNAIALAQRYLIMVSTTNNSSVARDAAQELIPETQH